MKTYTGVRLQLYYVTSVLEMGKWSALRSGLFKSGTIEREAGWASKPVWTLSSWKNFFLSGLQAWTKYPTFSVYCKNALFYGPTMPFQVMLVTGPLQFEKFEKTPKFLSPTRTNQQNL